MPLNLEDVIVIRGWIERLPYPALAGVLNSNDALAAREAVRRIRAALADKARSISIR